MKVQFEFTLDDLVDVAERALDKSRLAASLRWRGGAATVLLAGACVYLVTWGPAPYRLAFALAVGLVVAVFYPKAARSARQRRLRRLYRERLGAPGPFSCEVEITPSGITTTQVGARTTREWASIAAIEDRGDSIEFVTHGAGTVLVRNRAFRSRDEWREFLDTARGYLAQARPAGAVSPQNRPPPSPR
jgi:hypothetical protein